MTIEALSRDEVRRERQELVREMQEQHGTVDREDLRSISLSGDMTFEQLSRFDRLRALDYFTQE